MTDEPDIGEAVDYILAERPKLHEDQIWRVLLELKVPPPPSADQAALHLVAVTHPDIPRRAAKVMLREWRAYAGLAQAQDWSDLEDE